MLRVRSTSSDRRQSFTRRARHRVLAILTAIISTSILSGTAAAANDVVIYSSDVTTINGAWRRASDGAAAGGQKMVSSNSGWKVTGAPLAGPTHYFEARFTASANTAYRVWVRMKAASNSTSNDSVYMQFSDAVNGSGGALWRIGSASGILFNLERCSNCGVSGWGWRGGSWWTGESSIVRFPSSGTKTLRVQTREDGVAIDQIVLSPVTYYSSRPGAVVNDSTIVPQGGSSSTENSTTVKAIPGAVQSEDFDSGGSGVSYWDSSAGNSGGLYRSTNVDIERASEGGYNIGWTTRGEWLQYTVNVASSGTYTLEARVASYGTGGTFRVEFGGVNKTGSMTIPNTGGWQTWTTIRKNVSLSAGQQRMRVVFESVGASGTTGNLTYIRFISGGTTTPTPTTSPAPTGSKVRVMTWNVKQGRTAGGGYDLSGQVTVMANSGADVIMLQEVSVWDENQPAKYRDQLAARTGRTWYTVWGPSKSTGGCLGTLILSKYPISAAATTILYGTGVSKGTVTINGVPVTLTNVHLEYYDTSKRTSQLYAFMDWARRFSGPVIAGGDFNSWWGEWWIAQMETEFTDTWKVVKGNPYDGYTTGNVRFDYLFRSRYNGSRMNPTACWVISTDRSDHRPVVADYTVQ